MRETTKNEYDRAVNKVVDYINQHLFENPDIKQLAEIANISEYHFHRIFKAIIGENIGEYINRIRLEHIGQQLQMTQNTLDKIALKTGYTTKYALSKAFKKHFDVSPSVFRKQKKDTLNSLIKEKQAFKPIVPRIKEITSKKTVYIRIIDWYGSPESYRTAWRKLAQFANRNNLVNHQTEFIGFSFDNPTITKPENCRFYACFTTELNVQATGEFGIKNIDGGLYAIFTLRGSYSGLLDLYYYIYLKCI